MGDSALNVHNYLFITGENVVNAKRLKRKFNRKKIKHFMDEKHSRSFEHDIPKLLYNHILTTKKKLGRNKPDCIGLLTDNNVILYNSLLRLPPSPQKWDILCCESTIDEYDYKNSNNNIYWCAASIKSSRHFIINWNSIDKILPILKRVHNFTDLIKELNTLQLFTITQYNLSEPIKDQGDLSTIKLNKLSIDTLVSDYNKRTSHIKDSDYTLLPKISLICPATTTDAFFHTLYSFMKIDYPRDSLQLIVVDDQNLEKKLKGFLPDDSRIKIINISVKDTQEVRTFVTLPIGLIEPTKFKARSVIS
jgi:hypothetical protein